jgi:predicted DNA-binding mobile mystery protein A
MISAKQRALMRKMFDKRLADAKDIRQALEVPGIGWIATARQLLGMTAQQLGARMNITDASVRSLETKEREGRIRLDSLTKAAEAMNCTLVYGFVPNTGFEETVQNRAKTVLAHKLEEVSHSMALEDQKTEATPDDYQRELYELMDARGLWNDTHE